MPNHCRVWICFERLRSGWNEAEISVRYVRGGPGWRSRYSDLLQAGRFGDRMPLGARFSAHIQTGLGTLLASCAVCTASLSWDQSDRAVALTTTPPSAEVVERVELYIFFPSWPSWPLVGRIYLTFYSCTELINCTAWFWGASSPLCFVSVTKHFVYYTCSRTQLYFT